MSTNTGIVYSPIPIDQLIALEIPPIEYVVEGILPRGSLTLLSAREKAGKSLMTIDLAVSVAAGESFLGRAVSQGKTLLVPTEDNVREVKDRLLHRMNGLIDIPVDVLLANGYTDDRVRLDDVDSMQAMYNLLKSEEYSVVVLDPMRELHDLREDHSDDMGPLLRPLREMAHKTDTAIVLIHHQNKKGQFRGSGAIKASADQEMAFQRATTEDGINTEEIRGIVRVEGRLGPPVVVAVKLGPCLRWEPADLPQSPNEDLSARRRILDLLRDSPDECKGAEEIAANLNMPQQTARNVLTSLARNDPAMIRMHGSGRKGDPFRYQAIIVGAQNQPLPLEIVPDSQPL